MVIMDESKVMVFCDCDGEGIQLEYDADGDYTFFSFWSFGAKDSKTSLTLKLKFIWQIIRYGTPYGDQVILNKEGRIAMISALDAHNVKGLVSVPK